MVSAADKLNLIESLINKAKGMFLSILNMCLCMQCFFLSLYREAKKQ